MEVKKTNVAGYTWEKVKDGYWKIDFGESRFFVELYTAVEADAQGNRAAYWYFYPKGRNELAITDSMWAAMEKAAIYFDRQGLKQHDEEGPPPPAGTSPGAVTGHGAYWVNVTEGLARIEVPGGWLYRQTFDPDLHALRPMAFVPFPKEDRNA